MEKRDEKTPLQEKLEEMAEDIGKLGTIFAILTFHVLMIRFIVEGLFSKEINLFGTVPMSDSYKKWHRLREMAHEEAAGPGRLLQANPAKSAISDGNCKG